MAQTAGHLILVLEKFQRMPFLAQIETAKLRRFVEPGTALSISASLVHLGSGYAVTKAEVETETGAVAEAGIRFRSLPFPNHAMRDLMLENARRLGLDAPMRA
jgi:3-hydroxyacyl-[acyl-carrier-protein] dehydratase